jgi:peptidoglycan/LPS O-acetylase OafA/YrhL
MDGFATLSSFDPFLIFLSGIVLTLGFAELNYRWLEEPLRKLGRTISDRAVLATTGYLASNAA